MYVKMSQMKDIKIKKNANFILKQNGYFTISFVI